jgi:hypothetical protein
MDSRFRGNDVVPWARACQNHLVIPAKAGIHPERNQLAVWFATASPRPCGERDEGFDRLPAA